MWQLKGYSTVALFVLACLSSAYVFAAMCDGKAILGRIETVKLMDKNIMLDAKLDSGADTSSLSATDIKIVTQHHSQWVTFTVHIKDQKFVFTKPLIGFSRVLQRSDEQPQKNNTASYSVRPVVMMPTCLGDQLKTTKVNLIDRSHFQYPLLLGAKTLKQFHALLDVSKHHQSAPNCNV